MNLHPLTWLRLIAMVLVGMAWWLRPGLSLAQESVTVLLDPVGGSGVSGVATLTAAGAGTSVELNLKGLAPGATAAARMQANTCARPSASFAVLPNLTADAAGQAAAAGAVLFRGTEEVALATMADGGHVITIQTDRMVACGVIPALSGGAAPAALPGTGGAAGWLLPATLAMLGLWALLAGLFLHQAG